MFTVIFFYVFFSMLEWKNSDFDTISFVLSFIFVLFLYFAVGTFAASCFASYLFSCYPLLVFESIMSKKENCIGILEEFVWFLWENIQNDLRPFINALSTNLAEQSVLLWNDGSNAVFYWYKDVFCLSILCYFYSGSCMMCMIFHNFLLLVIHFS